MILNDFFKKHPLIKCTIKKSEDVTTKLVLYISYVIVGMTAICLTGYALAYGLSTSWAIIQSPLTNSISFIINGTWFIINGIMTILISIPWYVYLGIVIITSIPIYSFYWCIKREITQEDRNHTDNNCLAILFLFGLIAGTLTTFILGTHASLSWISQIIFCIMGFVIGGCLGIYIGQDIDTYLHYQKRMKEQNNNNQTSEATKNDQ